MSSENPAGQQDTQDAIEIDLRNPVVAAVWAWLLPGAGHFYQRRYAKGILFMVCILSTYFFGLTISGRHAVYASWTRPDIRWQYVCQLGVGAPALPALVQSQLVKTGHDPLFGGAMAPPRNVKPDDGNYDHRDDKLSHWHLHLNSGFELGTLYTMIAGLLNVLAIYDAFAGPMVVSSSEEKPPPDKDDGKDRKT